MDEPASALDPIATQRIEDLVEELKNDYTIVIVTHNMQQAARVADMTAFFSVDVRDNGTRCGVLVEHAPTSDLFIRPSDPAHRGVRHGPLRLAMAGPADKGDSAAGVAELQTARRRRGGAAARRAKPPPPERFLNRELSWLDWNDRCIQLGQDASVPLLHRIRLCSFISTGLDEFFMVRVAGLERQAASGLDVRSPDGRSPHTTLDEIATRVRDQVRKQSDLYEHELLPGLAEAGIQIGRLEQATRAELRALGAHYEREIYPVLTPLAIGPGQPFPYISGLSLSLGVFVRDPATRRGAAGPREGAGGHVPLRHRGPRPGDVPARGGHRPLPAAALPRHGSGRVGPVPGHARRRLRRVGRRRRPAPGGAGRAAPAPVRRRRAARGGASRCPSACSGGWSTRWT